MSPLIKVVLILFGLAYLISPADLIPDLMLPFMAGWLDDSVVLYCIYYLIRYGKLPWFAFKKGRKGFPNTGSKRGSGTKSHGPDHNRPGPGQSRSGNDTVNQSRRQQSHGSDQRAKSGQGNKTAGHNAQHQQKHTKPAAPTKTPYEILGVSPDASWEVIQKAHKEKIKQYHPDKLSHLGEEFSNLANEKFLEIQKAYDTLRKTQG